MKLITAILCAACASAPIVGCKRAEEPPASSAPPMHPRCDDSALKGTYTFLAVGYGPAIPPEVLPTPVSFGPSFPLQAIGSVQFDGHGNNKGFIHENVGGTLEDNVLFEGTYEVSSAPDGRGCQGTWKLQDHHRLPPFVNEPPHIFKITLSRSSNAFNFLTFGGGPGPVTLSGRAEIDVK